MDLTNQRQTYDKDVLLESSVPNNPIAMLEHWIEEALDEKVPEPYAMSLATCGSDMMPSVRTVLLREVTDSGIVFYTNYLSHKGHNIDQNPQAECLFFWHDMQRQIRVRGQIAKVSREKTDAYFQKRPYLSQIGAWVSQPQSGEVASRDVIDERFEALKAQYPEGSTVPTPDFWGGYEITASEIEFWQGGANRLHDRLLYTKNETENHWHLKRLLP